MSEKTYLGRISKDYDCYMSGENCYLTKHSFDCNWYWGFGYIGNNNCHMHFDGTLLTQETDVNKIFSDTKISQNEWWVIRDLFIQAYALKSCAEVYRHGGHQTSKKNVTDVIQSKELETRINIDLEKVLNTLWDYIDKSLNKVMFLKKDLIEHFESSILPTIDNTGDNLKYTNKVSREWDYFIEIAWKDKTITRTQYENWVNPYKNMKLPKIEE